ncbi:MAG TPA: LLM class flavin-dependent oxidoreductase [Acidimicrobiia bacterium]|nr:LLM class flavin-dependent oxidoreductase [Acidimicrobiia bacterium]
MALRIGINVSTAATPGTDVVGSARRAEELGFDFVSASDHLHGTHPSFETWTLLTWLAASTTRIGIVTNVLGLPYRSPAVTAKMAETLQRLSGGRFVLGLGAGGADSEFAAFGLDVRTPGQKIDALADALAVIRALWSDESATHEGEWYSVRDAHLTPKPDSPVPIWLGSYGPRALDLLGRTADGWLPSMPYAPPDAIPAMRDRIRAAADAASRDPDSLTYAYNVGVHVGAQVDRKDFVSGTPTEVVDRLQQLAGLGLDTFNLWPVGDEAEQHARIAAEVLPALR